MWAAVTGLAAEARILERRGAIAIATGGDEAAATAACARLVETGVRALVSFGIAGALAPGLAPGVVLLPRRVLDAAGGAYEADAAWRTYVLKTLSGSYDERDLLGRRAIAATAEEKAALHRETGAVAVDLESHLVAAAARHARLPFLALRAVADPGHVTLPPAALVGLDGQGRAAIGPVLRSLLAHPGQIAALGRLARDTRRALRALDGAARAL